MTDGPKFQGNVIKAKNVRIAFVRIDEAQQRTGKDGKPRGRKVFSLTALLDPSNTEHAATIKEIKAEAKRALDFKFGEGNWTPQSQGGVHIMCFGNGNDLPKQGKKLYDGYKDMFYVKLTSTDRPEVRNRRGVIVQKGEEQFPYGGCIANTSFTFYSYDNESKGLNGELRGVQFVNDGPAFGGGGDKGNDFEPIDGADGGSGGGGNNPDPFD